MKAKSKALKEWGNLPAKDRAKDLGFSLTSDEKAIMSDSDNSISIFIIISIYVNISLKRAIAQLGRAPRLHMCQCFFFFHGD